MSAIARKYGVVPKKPFWGAPSIPPPPPPKKNIQCLPAPSPRVVITEPERPRIQLNYKRMSVNDVNIKTSIQNANNKRTVRVPLARVLARSQRLRTNSHRIIRERSQLIHDKDTGEDLNYWQLLKDPKHAELWTHSAANEFGQLAQGVGTRIKGTNTIHFIQKDQVPNDRAWDVTYGSFSCNYKPNKEKKRDQDSRQGAIESTTQETPEHRPQTWHYSKQSEYDIRSSTMSLTALLFC